MIDINIISNYINNNNIKYIFSLKKLLNPIFIKDIENITKLPQNTYILVFNKLYNPKKNFSNEILDIIQNNKGFHFLSRDKEIYITNNITYENKILNIKKKNIFNILFDIKGNNYENININKKEYTEENVSILNDYYKSYISIFNKDYSYDAYKILYNEEIKNCYYIVYHIKDIYELSNLPKLKFYNHRIIISYTNIVYYDMYCLMNYCKVNNYKYIKNEDLFNSLDYLWFEKIIFMNYKSELNDTNINELNIMHESFSVISKFNLISIKAEYLAYLNDLNYTKSNVSYPSTDYDHTLLYTRIIEAKLLKMKGYDKIYEELMNIKIKTPNIMNKLITMSILCNKLPPQELSLNIDQNDIDILHSWFLLLTEACSNKIVDYTPTLKFVGSTIIDLIINKDMLDKNKNYFSIIIQVFDNLIKKLDNNTIIKLIDLAIYLKKYITTEQLHKIILLIMPQVSRFEATSRFTTLLESVIPEFDYTKLFTLFPNNPSIIDFMVHITCNFNHNDNLHIDVFEKRQGIEQNLRNLLKESTLGTYNLQQIVTLSPNNFYLSYHGVSSKNIFELKNKLFKKICPELNYSIDTSINYKNNKIKVCFISSMLARKHSVFKDRHQVIKQLSNNNLFDVYFITIDDVYKDIAREFGNATHIKVERNLEPTKKLLIDMKLDIIVYCEIGMDPFFYLLATMRFAKIQINTWGHSDTSGLDTIDYFFSSKLYELEYKKAQTHYTEKLILLNSLCTCYVNPLTPFKNVKFNDRFSYGYDNSTIIYFCAQSIFKFNKVYYDYIIQILSNNPTAILLMIKNEHQSIFIKNLNSPIVSRIHWMPPMQHKEYLNLISISDVVLDTFPFGGCNSSLEAFSLGKVVVTQPGQMINGRFTKGFYTKMGLKKYIMNNKKEYVDFAIKLANKEFRENVEKDIKENSHVLFNDKETITEWSDKLIELHNKHNN
jgi:predicted O-linked N-acetylglucosamine transferase (SPINDLY family)